MNPETVSERIDHDVSPSKDEAESVESVVTAEGREKIEASRQRVGDEAYIYWLACQCERAELNLAVAEDDLAFTEEFLDELEGLGG